MVPYGYTLPAAKAKVILEAAGVTPNLDIGDGFSFDYGGRTYWILQRGIKFPEPDSTSPDGWHIVYGPSQEEVEMGKPPASEPGPLEQAGSLLKLGLVALGLVLVVQIVGAIRR